MGWLAKLCVMTITMCIYVLYSTRTVDIDVRVCLRKGAQASDIRRRVFSIKTKPVWLFG